MRKQIAAIVPSNPDGCAFYRGLGIMNELRRMDVDTKQVQGKVSWMDISDCDIGFMQRPYTTQHLELAKLIRQQMPLWVDYDDLLTALPESNPAYVAYSATRIDDILRLADVVTVSTEALKDQISHADIRVIPNAYNDYRLPTRRNVVTRTHKIVLWRGTNTHVADLQVHKDAINALIKHNPETRFVFLGFVPWVLDLSAPNIDVLAEQNLYDYFRIIDSIAPDLLLVPLEDNLFNSCKSNIAWLEVARSGTMVVAPHWPEWDKPGVYTYTDDLFTTAHDALNDGEKDWTSWLYIQKNLQLSKINEQRAQVIHDFT